MWYNYSIRQHSKSFEDPMVNRIFASNVRVVYLYEDEIQKKEDVNYKDIYTMLPSEIHAHRMHFYVEEQLSERLGIEKTKDSLPEEELDSTQKIWEKARIMSKLSEYRTS